MRLDDNATGEFWTVHDAAALHALLDERLARGCAHLSLGVDADHFVEYLQLDAGEVALYYKDRPGRKGYCCEKPCSPEAAQALLLAYFRGDPDWRGDHAWEEMVGGSVWPVYVFVLGLTALPVADAWLDGRTRVALAIAAVVIGILGLTSLILRSPRQRPGRTPRAKLLTARPDRKSGHP